MELSNNLTSQFAKLNNNDTPSSGELVYGTTVMQGSKLFVNIDGSDTITPVVTTSDVKPGERVTVMIKDHSATIMGNITNPSAGTEEMGKVLDEYDTIIAKIGNFELVVADKVSTEQLEAELAIIDAALIGKATIADLDAVKATIEDLEVDELRADIARIDEAIILKADIADLDAVYADIDMLEANVADINTLVGGQLTMDNIQSLVLTTSKVTVDNAFIKDAMIDRVSASKLTAGTINTSLINIGSADGAMTITGSLQQFKDANGNVRIQIGKDASGDFTFALYGADGKGQLINQNGITASAISDGLIVNSMVAGNANISGSKLDISSVVTEINNGTETIKGSKIILDEKNQTFDVAFNKLSTTVENIQVGGRNLVINSDVLQSQFSVLGGYEGTRTVVDDTEAKSKKHLEFKCTTAGTGFHTNIFRKSQDKVGKTYTWSFWAKCNVAKSGEVGHECGGRTTISLTTDWQKFTHTWVFTDDQYHSFTWYINWNVDEILYIRDFKIEEGNKATDWTPAPEDTDSAIDTVNEKTNLQSTQISVAQGQIQTLISNTTITKENGQTVSLKDDYSSFQQTTDSAIDTLKDDYSSLQQTTDSAIDTINEKINSQSTQISVAQGQIQTLISDTTITKENGQTVSLKDDYSSFQQTVNGISSKLGSLETTYSSFQQTTDSAINTINEKVDNNNENVTSQMSSLQQNVTSQMSSLEQTLNGISSEVSSVETITEQLGNASTQNLLYNSDFKILNGNLPDGWTIGNNASISLDQGNILLDGIASFWFNITGLTERAWSAVFSPYIDAQEGEKFVASAYVLANNKWADTDDNVTLEIEYHSDSERIGTTTANADRSNFNWQRLVAKGTAPAGTKRVRIRVHPCKNGKFNMSKPMLQYGETVTGWDRGFDIKNITTRLTSAESKITEDAITNTVKKNFYTKSETEGAITSKGYQTESQVKQTADSIRSEVSALQTTVNNNKTSVESQISSIQQTVDSIDIEVAYKVDANSIISAINLSPESITISSDRINITGFVEFSDLSTAGYTTINGANITTGYISCDRLKGGTVSAADEINFVGGARIFGNEGALNAGLTVSAAGITLSGGSVNYLYGSWYLPTGNLVIESGDLKLSSGCIIDCYAIAATSISCSSISSSGNISTSGNLDCAGVIYGQNNLALARGSLWAPVGSATRDYLRFGSHILSSDSSYGVLLTDTGGSWATVRCGSVIANGTTLSSDIRLKTDIKYVNLDTQSIEESGLAAPNVNLTTEDMHSFIETLPIASYRLKNDVENGIDKTYYGFIAQDILYTKVGSELIEYDVVEVTPPTKDEEGNVIEEGVYDDKGLKYSENKFIAFVCGALQEEIRQRKELEQEVMSLKEIIEKGE